MSTANEDAVKTISENGENQWKISDNGYIAAGKPDVAEPVNSNSKSAVVQITRTGGTKTMVVLKKRPDKEKLLIAVILALIMFCGMLVIMVFIKKSQPCTGEYFFLLFIMSSSC